MMFDYERNEEKTHFQLCFLMRYAQALMLMMKLGQDRQQHHFCHHFYACNNDCNNLFQKCCKVQQHAVVCAIIIANQNEGEDSKDTKNDTVSERKIPFFDEHGEAIKKYTRKRSLINKRKLRMLDLLLCTIFFHGVPYFYLFGFTVILLVCYVNFVF